MPAGRSATLLRLEGVAPAVAAGERALAGLINPPGGVFGLIEADDSRALWRAIGGAWAFAASDAPVWRICAPPARAAALGAALSAAGAGDVYYDWGGGALWIEGQRTSDAGAGVLRAALASVVGLDEGHATLVRPGAATAPRTPRFQPTSPGVARLAARIRAQFDPKAIFNPGRMGPGPEGDEG